MKTKLLSISLVASLLAVLPLTAQIIFQDNFNNTTGTTAELNDNLALRQSGSYVTENGTVSWVKGTAGTTTTNDFQNRAQQLQTNLRGPSTTSSARGFAYLNQDFNADLKGSIYSVSFALSMEVFTTSSLPNTSTGVNNTAMRFHLGTSAARVASGSAADRDFDLGFTPYYDNTTKGWLLRASYVIGGASAVTALNIPISLQQISNEFYTPMETVSILFDEVANTVSASYGSTTLFSNVSLSTALVADGRYFGVQSLISSAAPSTTTLQHKVDDFSISIIPEPSTFALAIGFMALGATCFGRGRRARR
jgi:hypothetical protein